MAVKKIKINRKNAAGGYDVFHPETSDVAVWTKQGSRTLDQDLTEIAKHAADTDKHIQDTEILYWMGDV